MVVYELETLLSIPNLYCVYLVDDDTYITLRTLLENFDESHSIPKEFRDKNYISKLINLYNRQKNINIQTLKIKHSKQFSPNSLTSVSNCLFEPQYVFQSLSVRITSCVGLRPGPDCSASCFLVNLCFLLFLLNLNKKS